MNIKIGNWQVKSTLLGLLLPRTGFCKKCVHLNRSAQLSTGWLCTDAAGIAGRAQAGAVRSLRADCCRELLRLPLGSGPSSPARSRQSTSIPPWPCSPSPPVPSLPGTALGALVHRVISSRCRVCRVGIVRPPLEQRGVQCDEDGLLARGREHAGTGRSRVQIPASGS